MEYSFRLSSLFPDEISVIGSELIPVGCPMLKEVGERVVRERTIEIVNLMGRISAEAQSLSSIVTCADRLHEGDYKLYLYCDLISNKILGFLIIGKKKLYALDNSGAQHEMGPMCVLDFHIVQSKQRHGAGKYLFDYMLRNESIPVEHFAFESPSDKFHLFLKKHYNLTKFFAIANNFCIFDGFFMNRDDYSGKREPWHGLGQTPEILHRIAFSKEKEVQHLQQHQHPESQTDEQRRHVSAAGYGHGDTHQYRQHHTEIKDGGQMVNKVINQQAHDGQEQHVVSNGDTPQSHEMNNEQRRLVSAFGYGHGENQLLHQEHYKKKDSGKTNHVNKDIKSQHGHNDADLKQLHIADKNQPYQKHQNGGEYTYKGHPYANGEGKSEETHNFV